MERTIDGVEDGEIVVAKTINGFPIIKVCYSKNGGPESCDALHVNKKVLKNIEDALKKGLGTESSIKSVFKITNWKNHFIIESSTLNNNGKKIKIKNVHKKALIGYLKA